MMFLKLIIRVYKETSQRGVVLAFVFWVLHNSSYLLIPTLSRKSFFNDIKEVLSQTMPFFR